MNPKQKYKAPRPNKATIYPPEFVRARSAPPEEKEAVLSALRSKIPNLSTNSQKFHNNNSQKVPKHPYNFICFTDPNQIVSKLKSKNLNPSNSFFSPPSNPTNVGKDEARRTEEAPREEVKRDEHQQQQQLKEAKEKEERERQNQEQDRLGKKQDQTKKEAQKQKRLEEQRKIEQEKLERETKENDEKELALKKAAEEKGKETAKNGRCTVTQNMSTNVTKQYLIDLIKVFFTIL